MVTLLKDVESLWFLFFIFLSQIWISVLLCACFKRQFWSSTFELAFHKHWRLWTVFCGRVKHESSEFSSHEPAFMGFFVSCMSINADANWPSESSNPSQSLLIGQEWYKLYLQGAILGFTGPCLAHIAGVKVYTRCIPADCLPAPPPALEKPVCRLCCRCCSEAWLSLLSFPSRPLPPPSPCHTRSSPESICIPGRYWPPIGQVRAGRPQGSPTNGDGGCVTHRERTSCSTTLLLFLLQTAAIALSFLFF